MISVSLTVMFDDPFWIGLVERCDGESYEAAKITYGAEPLNAQVQERLLQEWYALSFSPPVAASQSPRRHANPKRMQREAHRAVSCAAVGTKAQQALKMQREQSKEMAASGRREARTAARDERYRLRRERQKARHRGH